jgi:hypothetical protein
MISLYGNTISDEGAVAMAQVLKINTSLQGLLYVHIVHHHHLLLLHHLDPLTLISLDKNQIGDIGALAIADGLKQNNVLQRLE